MVQDWSRGDSQKFVQFKPFCNMKILNFLVGLVRAINQLADEKADDWTAELVCYDDYDESFLGCVPIISDFIDWGLFS